MAELCAVQRGPFGHQTQHAWRQFSAIHAKGFYGQKGFGRTVACMEMGRIVVVVVHCDHDAEETADLRHAWNRTRQRPGGRQRRFAPFAAAVTPFADHLRSGDTCREANVAPAADFCVAIDPGVAPRCARLTPGYPLPAPPALPGPRSPPDGADTIAWLATLPDNGPSDGFFHDRRAIGWQTAAGAPPARAII